MAILRELECQTKTCDSSMKNKEQPNRDDDKRPLECTKTERYYENIYVDHMIRLSTNVLFTYLKKIDEALSVTALIPELSL